MKILVIIPMKKDTGTILDVIDDINRYAPEVDYLVINGTDEFRVDARLINNKIPHIKTVYQTRHGDAFSIGVQHAMDRGYDAVIEYSSRNLFDARDIPYFIRTYENSQASLILGTRFDNNDVKPTRRAKWLRRGVKLISGKNVTDPGLRFRLIGKDVMEEFNAKSWWSIGPDIIGYLVRNEVSYKEVHVNANSEKTLEYDTISKSTSHTWTDLLSMIFVQRFRKYRKRVRHD